MTRKYENLPFGRMVRAIFSPSKAAPRTKQVPIQESPKQSIDTASPPRQLIDYSAAGPVLDLVARMRHLQTVAVIPVRQPDFWPSVPHVPIGPATNGIPDQRYGISAYPTDLARQSYTFGPMRSPARQQAVPGYIQYQAQNTPVSNGYPAIALKAPRPRRGGGQCEDN
jgi:hypothetical protein